MSRKIVTSWSGGKDSCFALVKAIENGCTPMVLLNMMNEDGIVSRSHGIPEEILKRQAQETGLPLLTKPASWINYERIFKEALLEVKKIYHVETVVFGDIDLQEHKDWEEKICDTIGLNISLPLWKSDRKQLMLDMINEGIETYIVSCNERMGESFLGKKITTALIRQLVMIGIDPCGENGEYHTLVLNAPIFRNRIEVRFGSKSNINNFWFIEMQLG